MIRAISEKVNLTAALIIIGVIFLIVLGLVAANSYFNYQEVQALVEGANQQGLGYEVVIHNQLTNSYSFHLNE